MKKKKYLIGSYEKAFPNGTSVSEMLRLSKEASYDFFEISIDRTDERISRLYNDEFLAECYEAVRTNDIQIGSMCLSALSTYTLGNSDPDIAKRAMEILERAIIFSSRLGIRIVQIPGCDVPKNGDHTDKTNDLFFKNVRAAVETASVYGVCLAVENMEDSYMDTVKKSVKLVEAVNSPYLQLYPDSGNITSASKIYSTDDKEDMMNGFGHYIAFHLKETRPNKYGGLFYGEGHVDFQRMVNYAWKLGARRFVMEYWYTGNKEWISDLSKAREMCSKWIEKAASFRE